jgi:hypothetical protein
MKIKSLFFGAMVVCASSMAALLQPAVPMSEETGCRISVGAYSNLGNVGASADRFGASNLMGGINFTHFAGYDFFYGVGVGVGAASGNGLFSAAAKGNTHAAIDAELSAGFLPELAERLNFGVVVAVGYGHTFSEELTKQAKAAGVKFGDMNVKAGLALSYGFTDSVHLYLAPTYALTKIQFFGEGTLQQTRNAANLSGIQIPVGLSFGVADDVAMFVETTTKFNNLKAANIVKTHQQEVALGFSFGM